MTFEICYAKLALKIRQFFFLGTGFELNVGIGTMKLYSFIVFRKNWKVNSFSDVHNLSNWADNGTQKFQV